MRVSLAALVTLATAAHEVLAHGYVPQLKIGNSYVAGWDLAHDPYTTPRPSRVVRATPNDSGFIADPTSKQITCSVGNNPLPSTQITANVTAGGTVQVLWNTWPLGHYGPVMNYMAACNGPCSSFLGDTGSPWFKISQDVYNSQTNIWASDALANNNHSYTVAIPKNIVPGQYLLRHEILALHGATQIGGAQFYPVCIQLNVQGGGSFKPTGNVSFPGSYSPTDPGIHFNPYLGNANNAAYVAPGGGVLAGLQF